MNFGPASANRAKIDRREIDRIKRGLERKDESTFDLFGAHRPHSAYARNGAGAQVIDELVPRWGQFNAGGLQINKEHALRFIDQFPERLVPTMLAALQRLEFLSRDDLVTHLRTAALPLVTAGALLVPLTRSTGESASHVGYFLAKTDLGDPVSLDEALETEKDIVLFDDCLVSGHQSTGVIHTLMLGERATEKAAPLTADQRQRMLARHVHLVFAYTAETGRERLQEKLAEARLDAATIHGVGSFRADKSLDEVSGGADLREFLERVGFSLLQSSTELAECKCRARALGWGNSEHLVVTTFGVPRGTVTALWHHGRFRNTDWEPLFPVPT